MRLSPAGHRRLRQTQELELVYGGAEVNVAILLANFGLPVQTITRFPNNKLENLYAGAPAKWGRN